MVIVDSVGRGVGPDTFGRWFESDQHVLLFAKTRKEAEIVQSYKTPTSVASF